jgi:hypothetical protein
MRHDPDIRKIETDVAQFFSSELASMAKEQKWNRDSQWTDGIHKRLAEIGHGYGFLVFASQSRCAAADGPEWLYDHHWRIAGAEVALARIPLVMEIEWGFGAATIFEKITKDFLKLVQARADLRVMVFQGNGVVSVTDKLVAMAENFEGSQQGDRWLFAGWGWDTDQMHCRLWSA